MLRATTTLLTATVLLCQGALGDEACEADEAGLLQSTAKKDARRVDGAQVLEAPRMIAEALERHLKAVVEEAASKHKKNDESIPPPHAVEVDWLINGVEKGTKVSIAWDHGCDAAGAGAQKGTCYFAKSDNNNPGGMHIELGKDLDAKARMFVSTKVSAGFINMEMSTDCAMCGEECKLDSSIASVVIKMPDCPISGRKIFLPGSAFDLSGIPDFMHASITSTTTYKRGDGSVIANVHTVVSV
uniref:Uncharacterized protein n=1 Tax=Alexandrium andersonii TaxID=327968 RepID=A0A7S2F7P5_9DINO|mmetsp:Transcript_19210/g.43695  ORF Transcript_19210/g.43695 Transcript_19210/m.43695 type:complete len:243 (+) Transcript_19210:78-806(+)